MDTEIALLKQRADQADQRLGRMEGKLDQISDVLRHVATKEDVKRAENASWNGLAVGGSVAIAIMALFVGVLAYLQDQRITTRPEPPQLPPIILNLPAAPTPPTPLPPATPAP